VRKLMHTNILTDLAGSSLIGVIKLFQEITFVTCCDGTLQRPPAPPLPQATIAGAFMGEIRQITNILIMRNDHSEGTMLPYSHPPPRQDIGHQATTLPALLGVGRN
jgi:hypothetical protein